MVAPQPAHRGCGPLDEHLIFSSGWEWGYWLNDYTSLRNSYELDAAPQDGIVEAYEPDMPDIATIVDRIATAQHDGLMRDHLAGYMAGRDAVIDAGRVLNIVSQPDRITFDQLTPDILEGVHEAFPHATIFARVFDRRALIKLKDAPLEYGVREVLESAVQMARRAMRSLSIEDGDIDRAEQEFRRRDRERLRVQLDGGDIRAATREMMGATRIGER